MEEGKEETFEPFLVEEHGIEETEKCSDNRKRFALSIILGNGLELIPYTPL